MEKDGRYSNLELDQAIKKYGLDGAEKGLYTKILYGVLERMNLLDAIISSVSTRDINLLDSEIRAILRSGAYQIHFLDKVPVSAACNEAVKLAAARNPGTKGYVNAVMRAVARIKLRDFFENLRKTADDESYISIRYSVSKKLATMLISQYGFETVSEMLEAIYDCGQVTALRVNTLKTDAQTLISAFENLSCEKSGLCEDIITVSGGFAPKGERHFENGEYFIQSEPSCLCAKVLGAKPFDTVIDACACPGGKTFSIAIDMENKGKIFACDIHKNKLSLVKDGAEKLGIYTVETKELDGRNFESGFEGFADAVLCDVPCSGIGSIAKKPEIRYKDIEEIKKLPEIQYAILQNNARYVKSGGVLVYSTCTVNKEENEAVVKKFIENNADFTAVKFDVSDKFKTVSDGIGICFLPSKNCVDGFYIAKFMRKSK